MDEKTRTILKKLFQIKRRTKRKLKNHPEEIKATQLKAIKIAQDKARKEQKRVIKAVIQAQKSAEIQRKAVYKLI